MVRDNYRGGRKCVGVAGVDWQRESTRFILMGLLITAALLLATLSGCSSHATDSMDAAADSSRSGGVPSELGAIPPLEPIVEKPLAEIDRLGDSESPAWARALNQGFCLTRSGESVSLKVERSLIASPMCRLPENPCPVFFSFSRHTAA